MAETYCTNNDIKYINGRQLTELFDMSLSEAEIEIQKDIARDRSFYKINAFIQGKTATPSTLPQMKQIELDFAISYLLTAAYSNVETNESDFANVYDERARELLESLQFPASNTEPEGCNTNTGNGTISVLNLKESFLKSETWFITAQNANNFSVEGSSSGYIGQATLSEIFPEHGSTSLAGVFSDYGMSVSSYRSIPFSFIIAMPEIDPISFVTGDNFTFRTYAGKDIIKSTTGRITRG